MLFTGFRKIIYAWFIWSANPTPPPQLNKRINSITLVHVNSFYDHMIRLETGTYLWINELHRDQYQRTIFDTLLIYMPLQNVNMSNELTSIWYHVNRCLLEIEVTIKVSYMIVFMTSENSWSFPVIFLCFKVVSILLDYFPLRINTSKCYFQFYLLKSHFKRWRFCFLCLKDNSIWWDFNIKVFFISKKLPYTK